MTVKLDAQRQEVRALLNEFDAADALASYYALHHDPARSALFIHRDREGRLIGFLARCQTGFDLFRPVVTMRVRGPTVPPSLLREGLVPERPYLLIVPDTLAKKLRPHLEMSEMALYRVLRLDPARYVPVINVMVEERVDENGNPRCEIRRGERLLAMAGVNWRSPIFAEVFVNVGESSRGRGWGKALVSACSAALLAMGVTPVYVAAEGNVSSLALAQSIGFVDTGAREVVGQVILRRARAGRREA